MENAEITESDWQFSVRSYSVVKHETMTRAIHRLHAKSLGFNFKQIDIILIVFVMAGSLPQFKIEHIGSDNLTVSSYSVLGSYKVHKLVVYLSSMGVPETTTR